ncbi:MAG: linear amide C-N hydrolase [Symbiopectobacterium sp.]|uniref:linear amide C-N hydrolase n=1 Tax=Symbiopectobacterium sp. TaxID=2952789 RepID=UPI003F402BA5
MKKKRLLWIMFPLFFSVQFSAESCTSLTILDMNNNLYHARTLELTTDLPFWIMYYPKNTGFQKKMPDGKNGVRYQFHYKILAISIVVASIS